METRFVPNPVTPDLYRYFTVSFPGGSLRATKDVLESMFENDNLFNTCDPETKEVSRKQYNWTSYPQSSDVRIVQATTYTLKNYSNGGNSAAEAGEPIKILINGSYWTARLTGSHQDFMDYLCANRASLAEGFSYWKSQAGKPYAVSSATTSD